MTLRGSKKIDSQTIGEEILQILGARKGVLSTYFVSNLIKIISKQTIGMEVTSVLTVRWSQAYFCMPVR